MNLINLIFYELILICKYSVTLENLESLFYELEMLQLKLYNMYLYWCTQYIIYIYIYTVDIYSLLTPLIYL